MREKPGPGGAMIGDMAQSARSFVGRDPELQTLTGLLGVATATGDRQHVLLAGDAGVGKTRLLTALRDRAVTDGWQVHAGHCVDFGESAVAYMPFSEILDRIVSTGYSRIPLADDSIDDVVGQRRDRIVAQSKIRRPDEKDYRGGYDAEGYAAAEELGTRN